ncbi:MAG: DUF4347 domain-containing protein, partial [Phycisphaerae bacterium]|nr:DUF4347 domain-containing protein [Phycisphaerae bacterium]
NWYQSWTDHAGDGYGGNTDRDFDQRSHEPMNRIATRQLAPGATTPVDLGVGSPPAFEYDYAANLKSHKEWTGSGTSTNTVEYKHDAWNRLVQVKVAGADRSLQGYNALHWRTCKVADVIGSGTGASAGPDGTIEQVRLMYYSADWQLLEERVDNAAASTTTPAKLYDGTWTTSGVDRRQQYLWGTRYIDDIVLHRIDRNADGDYTDTTDGTWYHLTDAQFSSVCLTDRSANVVERVTYSAYGVARHHWKGDVDGDGDVDTSGSSSDRGIVSGIAGQTLANRTIGGSAYRAEADLDRNGVVEVADRNLIPTAIAGRPEGQLTDTGAQGPEGQIGWQGYVFSPDYEWYLARYRTYSPQLGRWAARDSEGYPDGMSLFAFARSSPTNRNDSMGRTSEILNRVKPKQPRESEPNTAPGFVDTGTPLGPRGECKCGISREIEIDILDYGRYRDSFNEWAGRLTIGEHEVRNLQQVLDAIRSQVRSEELLVGDGCVCIKTLRIIGHGDFGTISIGAGKGGVSVEQPAPGGGTTIVQTFPSGEPEADEYLTADNVKTLREFAAYMCPDGEVVLWGCNVAKGNDGKSLLKKLAGILGVRVSAPTGEIDAFGNIYHGDWETVHP